jgi:hypothetical protein
MLKLRTLPCLPGNGSRKNTSAISVASALLSQPFGTLLELNGEAVKRLRDPHAFFSLVKN